MQRHLPAAAGWHTIAPKYFGFILLVALTATNPVCAFSVPPSPSPSPPPASSPCLSNEKYRIAIIGGGTSGMFAASSIVNTLHKNLEKSSTSLSNSMIEVKVYESTHKVLRTIRSSSSSSTYSSSNGGILHDTSKKIRELLNEGYPRGRKEITSLLTKDFPPVEQQAWFEERGVVFRVERDGAVVVDMSAATNDADGSNQAVCNRSKICDAILAEDVAELVETSTKITSISKNDDDDDDVTNAGFQLTIQGRDEVEHCNCLILATGNSHLGYQLATSLHHTIQKSVRSSFAFLLDSTNPLFYDLIEDVGVHHRRRRKQQQQQQQQQQHFLLPHVRLSYKVKIKGRKRPRVHKSEGPARLEILHNNRKNNDDDDNDDDAATINLAGKAASSLSSLAAYDLHDANCTGSLLVHFCPEHLGGKVEMIEKDLWRIRQEKPREVVGDKCPFVHRFVDYDEYDWETESFKVIETQCIPAVLWASMTESCGAPPNSTWGKMSPKKVRKLAELIVGCPFEFKGRVTSTTASGGDPYINAGGILLNEMDMSTMKSKVVENLFCCGQVLDGDASTSGFLFMRDFAMGKVAGENAALLALRSIEGGDE